MKGKTRGMLAAGIAALCLIAGVAAYFVVRARFPMPYGHIVRASGLDEPLVYAVMKAESGFDESAVSRAGAVGLMQLLPSTAEFICSAKHIPFDAARLGEGEYNVRLGCLYLSYLLEKFPVRETALAAYNAGEGVVGEWLRNARYSADGCTLTEIPFAETRTYLKKIEKFTKIYAFFINKT